MYCLINNVLEFYWLLTLGLNVKMKKFLTKLNSIGSSDDELEDKKRDLSPEPNGNVFVNGVSIRKELIGLPELMDAWWCHVVSVNYYVHLFQFWIPHDSNIDNVSIIHIMDHHAVFWSVVVNVIYKASYRFILSHRSLSCKLHLQEIENCLKCPEWFKYISSHLEIILLMSSFLNKFNITDMKGWAYVG